jgi:hypothetical protein
MILKTKDFDHSKKREKAFFDRRGLLLHFPKKEKRNTKGTADQTSTAFTPYGTYVLLIFILFFLMRIRAVKRAGLVAAFWRHARIV